MNMATIERFEDLEAWQRAQELTNVIYDISDVDAFARDFGLRDQIRRAAVSIMSNIAEGFESRTSRLDFIKIRFDFWTAFCVSAKFGSYAARNMFP